MTTVLDTKKGTNQASNLQQCLQGTNEKLEYENRKKASK